MTGILFLYQNLFDSATLTESSQATGFPVENLQNPFRTKVYRTAGTPAGTANIVIDHGMSKAINCIALTGYNWISAPSTLTLEFSVAYPAFTPVGADTQILTWAASPTTNGNKAVIIKTFASKNYQYNRLNVVYAPGDWDLGRVFLGTYFQPTRNYLADWSMDFIDPSLGMVTIGGQDHFDELEGYRPFSFSFLISTQAQFESFQAMINQVGIRKDLFIAFDYDSEPDELTVYGKFAQLPEVVNVPVSNKRINFRFRESR